jgi:hypothetical protein
MTPAEEVAAHWNAFCDSEPGVPDGFDDRMEAAGLAELRAVTAEDLEQAFAAERGIERGGMIWCLTAEGQKAFDEANADKDKNG